MSAGAYVYMWKVAEKRARQRAATDVRLSALVARSNKLVTWGNVT